MARAAAAAMPEVSELVTEGTPRVVVVIGTYLVCVCVCVCV